MAKQTDLRGQNFLDVSRRGPLHTVPWHTDRMLVWRCVFGYFKAFFLVKLWVNIMLEPWTCEERDRDKLCGSLVLRIYKGVRVWSAFFKNKRGDEIGAQNWCALDVRTRTLAQSQTHAVAQWAATPDLTRSPQAAGAAKFMVGAAFGHPWILRRDKKRGIDLQVIYSCNELLVCVPHIKYQSS